MINDRQDLKNTLDLLEGCINRICVTDDLNELNDKYKYALKYFNEIYTFNDLRIKNEPAEKEIKEVFRVIVAGGRDFNNYDLLEKTLDYLFQNVKDEIIILSGNAPGADTLGEQYATKRGFALEKYPADWNQYGKAAGPIRNEIMAENADALVAFWDGKSPGTKSMIEIANKYELIVKIKRY